MACVVAANAQAWPAYAQSLYVSEQGAGVAVIDPQTLVVTARFATGAEPRGIAVTADGRSILTANKGTGDLSVINRASGVTEKRIPVGPSAEFVRTLGGMAYVTYEPPADKGGLAHIAVVDLAAGRVMNSIPSGHETEGVEFSTDGRQILVTNEGDDTVSVYALPTGTPVTQVHMPEAGMRPRGLKRLPDGRGYVVTLEFAAKFLVLDNAFKVVKTADTAEAPYGVGFDPGGTRLFVAAAKAGEIQVFDAKTYAHITDIKTGKRCWHFAFSPDGARLAAACGRSGDLWMYDAKTYASLGRVAGLKLPWGVISYPAAGGSLQ